MTPIWKLFWYQMLTHIGRLASSMAASSSAVGCGRFDVALEHLVGQFEAGEHAAHRAGLAAHQQLQHQGDPGSKRAASRT